MSVEGSPEAGTGKFSKHWFAETTLCLYMELGCGGFFWCVTHARRLYLLWGSAGTTWNLRNPPGSVYQDSFHFQQQCKETRLQGQGHSGHTAAFPHVSAWAAALDILRLNVLAQGEWEEAQGASKLRFGWGMWRREPVLQQPTCAPCSYWCALKRCRDMSGWFPAAPMWKIVGLSNPTAK